MIIPFIIAIASLLTLFCSVIIIHFIRHRATESINLERRNQLNHELYDIRLKEVEEDIQQGIVVDKEAIVTELQYNLLDDIEEKKSIRNNNTKVIWIPGVILLVITSVFLYSLIGNFHKVKDWDAALQRYPATYNKLFKETNSQPNEQELEDLLIGLRTHLDDQPDDSQGWVLYSRLGRIFQDTGLAIGGIEKALKASPDNTQIKLEYIELKMKIGDQFERATAEAVLIDLLTTEPDNYDAWSMYAFLAVQQKNFSAAIQRWTKMLSLVEQSSEKFNMLKSSIAYAQKQLTLAEAPVAQVVNSQNQGVDNVSYQVNVTVSDQVTYTKGNTLFIYAQSVNGSAPPIAAIKVSISDFPESVELSDLNAMMQNVKLSDYPEFKVKARISTDGTVNQSDGQWFGESEVIKAGQTTPISIRINQQL